jgi:hypothetical protein
MQGVRFSPPVQAQAVAAAPVRDNVAGDAGDTKQAPKRTWDSARDLPRDVSSNSAIRYDYPIVYVRVPRPYPKEYYNINHLNQAGLHQTNAPGAELRVLYPDGRDESLVPVTEKESITDPMVSFDGQWVYFARFHEMDTGATASMTNLQSRRGADIYKIHVATRKLVQLTQQTRTPNTGAIKTGVESHPRGVHNLAPCPVPGGKIVFVSDRNGYRGVREQTQPALQLFVMDDDGSNIELIGPMNLGTALHPVMLTDGRVMFSSLETQGLRSDERWGIWAIRPDGTNWGPLTSALGSPPGQAVHFQTQLSDGSIVVETYYQTGSTDGFGTYWKFPMRAAEAGPHFAEGARQFAPKDMVNLTLFAGFEDVRPNHRVGDVYGRQFLGNVTHPSAAPDNHLLTTWAIPLDAQDQTHAVYDAGIYLIPRGRPINHPSKMLMVKNDPQFQELWPRALVPYKRIYGIDAPPSFTHANDGTASPHLEAGTPFGLVGTSSLYKRESYPDGVVPDGSVTAVSAKPADRLRMWRELSIARFGNPGNWGEQGGDAGLYENSDIWGVRILLLEPVSDVIREKGRHYALVSDSDERIRILGEFPVRKFVGDNESLDPDGNPDTSFLAKVPADTAWTFQTLDRNGMVLNMAQTWHQVRPGEVRNNCGGCHAHSQQPTDFALTAAARQDYKVWDLTNETPLFTTKAHDSSGRKWDKDDRTGVRIADTYVKNVEFYRDIKPILERSCVACHTKRLDEPAGDFVLDDESPIKRPGLVPWAENVQVRQGLPRNYARIVQYAWAFQARRSPLVWKIYGQRLDGFRNENVPSPAIDYENEKDVLDWCHHSQRFKRDVDFTGSAMPPPEAIAGIYKGTDGRTIKVPPLSDEDKLTIVRWIDIGCPIDLDYDPNNPSRRGGGWMLDEGRATLTLASPTAGVNAQPVSAVLVGMHDYYTGLAIETFEVTADFSINGAAPGENLAGKFARLPGSRFELKLNTPITTLAAGTLTISIEDRQGNRSRIDRKFSVKSAPAN